MQLNPKSPTNRLFGFPPGSYNITTWNERLHMGQQRVVFTTLQEVEEFLAPLGLRLGALQEHLELYGEAILDDHKGKGWTASIVYYRPGR